MVEAAKHPKIVGIGETGLDYYWCKGDLSWQHQRFADHIQAANESGLPVIVHTRDAAEDTLRILKDCLLTKRIRERLDKLLIIYWLKKIGPN